MDVFSAGSVWAAQDAAWALALLIYLTCRIGGGGGAWALCLAHTVQSGNTVISFYQWCATTWHMFLQCPCLVIRVVSSNHFQWKTHALWVQASKVAAGSTDRRNNPIPYNECIYVCVQRPNSKCKHYGEKMTYHIYITDTCLMVYYNVNIMFRQKKKYILYDRQLDLHDLIIIKHLYLNEN